MHYSALPEILVGGSFVNTISAVPDAVEIGGTAEEMPIKRERERERDFPSPSFFFSRPRK